MSTGNEGVDYACASRAVSIISVLGFKNKQKKVSGGDMIFITHFTENITRGLCDSGPRFCQKTQDGWLSVTTGTPCPVQIPDRTTNTMTEMFVDSLWNSRGVTGQKPDASNVLSRPVGKYLQFALSVILFSQLTCHSITLKMAVRATMVTTRVYPKYSGLLMYDFYIVSPEYFGYTLVYVPRALTAKIIFFSHTTHLLHVFFRRILRVNSDYFTSLSKIKT
jgi:hypothetical protein